MQTKTFRLFISSTFTDFEDEREVLHKKVFPKVEKHCAEQGCQFQPVDLRWGINNEAQFDQKTLEVCLEEVRACKHFPYPNFLIMAGDRYGYVPLPYMIEESEFKKIFNYVKENNKDISITYKPELDSDKKFISQKDSRKTTHLDLLKEWYALDRNQIYTKPNGAISTATILQVRKDDYKIYVNWEAEEISLRKILQNAVSNPNVDIDKKEEEKYFLSATEQEVIEGICDFGDKTDTQKDCDEKIDKEYIYGYTRTIQGANDKYIDAEVSLKDKANTFKENLIKTLDKDNNIFTSIFKSVDDYKKNELNKFENYITEKLIASIDEQLKNYTKISKLKQENSEQKKFLQDKVKGFQGREKTLISIQNYLEIETTEPLIIYGPSGMGKSSLIAKAIEDTKDDNKIFRFVGATANSTTIRKLLISIVDELQAKDIIEKVQEYELDENKFDTQIKNILLSMDKDITIFIDALDQLQHINYLNWLPNELPSKLKIILSVLSDTNYKEDSHYYKLLSKRYNNKNTFIDITEDSLKDKKETLIQDLLKVEYRKLNKAQTDYLRDKWAKTNYSPLYLKIAIEEVKHWKYCEDDRKEPTLCKTQKLNEDVVGIISEYLDNLDGIYHHEELLIKKVFGYIHASKDGLSEQELLHILSEDLEDDKEFRDVIINKFHKAIKVKNPRRENIEEHILPISIWSRLHTQIKPFIIERNIDKQLLMKFFHRQFTTVIDKYIKDDKQKLYTKLAGYFYTLQDNTKIWDKRYYSLRMLSELPYQLFQSNNSIQLKEILFDLEFAGSIYNNYKQDSFRDILKKAPQLDNIAEDEIYPWESFYREKEHLITKVNEELWRPHQSLFQLAYEDGLDSPLHIKTKNIINSNKINWYWLKNHFLNPNIYRNGIVNNFIIPIYDDGIPYEVIIIYELENNDILFTVGTREDYNGEYYINNLMYFIWDKKIDKVLPIEEYKHKDKIGKYLTDTEDEKYKNTFQLTDGSTVSVENNTINIKKNENTKIITNNSTNHFGEITIKKLNSDLVLSHNYLEVNIYNPSLVKASPSKQYILINTSLLLQNVRILSWSNNILEIRDILSGEILLKKDLVDLKVEGAIESNDEKIFFWSIDFLYYWNIIENKIKKLEKLTHNIFDALNIKNNRILFLLNNDTLYLFNVNTMNYTEIIFDIDVKENDEGFPIPPIYRLSDDEIITWDIFGCFYGYQDSDNGYLFKGASIGDFDSNEFSRKLKSGESLHFKKHSYFKVYYRDNDLTAQDLILPNYNNHYQLYIKDNYIFMDDSKSTQVFSLYHGNKNITMNNIVYDEIAESNTPF